MIKKDSATAHGEQIPTNVGTGPVSRRGSRMALDRQVKIRFLLQSASYLGVNLAQHELAARYIQD